ncbi:hypothetical protein EPA93_20290 [Ktedonosporobacter rubrisoli]|uniref:Zinc ribbon domain-containing protein n=1 Tax=Ktedonosporobacter rubrisoli TaxID=2509675 RepID=A0A4V0YZ22_KTERU|nr:hypothetical protein [Ktedonosporobacter rubrisoli]QBD78211.1 hypothetical protein EPA93_20290 [Ktedonosporobacter rubrisoli]
MQRCPQCSLDNRADDYYCARCGTLLQDTSDNTQLSPRNVVIPPPPPSAHAYQPTTPASFSQASHKPDAPFSLPPTSTDKTQKQLRPRAHTLLCVILYVLGISFIAFGTFGALIPFASNALDASILFVIFIGGLFGLVPILKYHKTSRLRWWQRLLWIIGTIVVGFLILALAPSLIKVVSAQYIAIGGTMIIGGLLITIFAFS